MSAILDLLCSFLNGARYVIKRTENDAEFERQSHITGLAQGKLLIGIVVLPQIFGEPEKQVVTEVEHIEGSADKEGKQQQAGADDQHPSCAADHPVVEILECHGKTSRLSTPNGNLTH